MPVSLPRYKVFISHATPDLELATRLYEELNCQDCPTFLASKSIQWGDCWADTLERSLTQACVVVVLLSEHSAVAFHQKDEIRRAVERLAKAGKDPEEDQQFLVLPVMLGKFAAQTDDVPHGLRLLQGIAISCEPDPRLLAALVIRRLAELRWIGVLVVDDDRIPRDAYRELLFAKGYRVWAAGSVLRALEIFQRWRDAISFVVLDHILDGPGPEELRDGVALLTRLRDLGFKGTAVMVTDHPTAVRRRLADEPKFPEPTIIAKSAFARDELARELANVVHAAQPTAGVEDPAYVDIYRTTLPDLARLLVPLQGAARRGRNVVLIGERGVGRRALGWYVHKEAHRVGPFVDLGGSVPSTVLAEAASWRHGVVYVQDVDEVEMLAVARAAEEQQALLVLGLQERPSRLPSGSDTFEVPPLRTRPRDVAALAACLRERADSRHPPEQRPRSRSANDLQLLTSHPLPRNRHDLWEWACTGALPARESPGTPNDRGPRSHAVTGLAPGRSERLCQLALAAELVTGDRVARLRLVLQRHAVEWPQTDDPSEELFVHVRVLEGPAARSLLADWILAAAMLAGPPDVAAAFLKEHRDLLDGTSD